MLVLYSACKHKRRLGALRSQVDRKQVYVRRRRRRQRKLREREKASREEEEKERNKAAMVCSLENREECLMCGS